MDVFTANSSDLEDTREEYKNELILLHAILKKLDRDMDFSAILNPLLAETGPAMTHVPASTPCTNLWRFRLLSSISKIAGPFSESKPYTNIWLFSSSSNFG
jgi:hypothetical protein